MTTREAFSGVVSEKLVADPDSGHVPVFQNTVPESVMAVLRNGPARFGGR
jgi:hypothetical protein